MSNYKIIFCGSEFTPEHELEVFYNTNNEITISIDTQEQYPTIITLDKATAIKLTRVLKSEISKIES